MGITQNSDELPINIVGSSVFGRYPIVNAERTYNMFISDGWLVSFPGYRAVLKLLETEVEGRALYYSVRGNFLIAVAGANVYRINNFSSDPILLGTVATTSGDVYIDENLSSQICLVDGTEDAYIYNYLDNLFGVAVFTGGPDFKPNYITYQNTYFIFGNGNKDNSGSQWFVYESGATALELKYVQLRTLQTKPDYAIAALRIPGKGNNLIVFGTTVAEIWTQVPGIQVYQRSSSVNIDFGLLSISTLASSDEIVCWLGVNEESTPSIMVMTGGGARRISTDGIDFLLANIKFPQQSTAFFFRQDGHLFYQITFYNPEDNGTVIYDFNEDKFFDLTDWNFDYHPARKVAYFHGETYFISLKNANIYVTDTEITTDEIDNNTPLEIPRIRVCNTIRGNRPEKFRVSLLTFTIENGYEPSDNFPIECNGYVLDEENNAIIYTEDDLSILVEGGYCNDYSPRIDLTISKNGGKTFSNAVPYYMHRTGHYNNQPRFTQLGMCNQFTPQFRFWGFWRFVVKDAVIEIN